jgi:nicotinamide phosphoribosyltransferase
MFKRMTPNPILWTDGYKFLHKDQYPSGIEWVFETWTPRKSRIEGVNHAVFFGLQGALAELTLNFQDGFFDRPLAEVMNEIATNFREVFNKTNPEMVANYDFSHFAELHKLGYLPIRIKALPEGAFVPIGVPMFTIENTLPEFYWLPGFLEIVLSNSIWQPITCATIANKYRRILDGWARRTGVDPELVANQAGDFSMRGMGSPEAAYRSAGGHLLSFNVSSTISAREYLKAYYQAGPDVSVYGPSTEHSVMCSYGPEREIEAFRHLITEVYPSGNVTIVSDSYDFWGVIANVLPALKDVILARDGKVGIRPDSDDPVKALCGDPDSSNPLAQKGLVECLWNIFGGGVNALGFKQLDPHIGATYGDSITPERADAICAGLADKGFASINDVLGLGSYTYQYMTRDTLGFALKCTGIVINGQFQPIFKDPKTDRGNFKKSHKGLVAVVFEDGEYRCVDGLDPVSIRLYDGRDQLREVFVDGKFVVVQAWNDIKQRVAEESVRVYGKGGRK